MTVDINAISAALATCEHRQSDGTCGDCRMPGCAEDAAALELLKLIAAGLTR